MTTTTSVAAAERRRPHLGARAPQGPGHAATGRDRHPTTVPSAGAPR